MYKTFLLKTYKLLLFSIRAESSSFLQLIKLEMQTQWFSSIRLVIDVITLLQFHSEMHHRIALIVS